MKHGYTKSRGTVIFKYFDFCKQWKAELWLSSVKRNTDGTIKSGWVVNGAWNYERRGNEELAKNGNEIRNRWPIEVYKEVPVTEDWIEVKHYGTECYNQVMQRAQAIMDNDTTYEFKFKSQAELERIKQRQEELEAMYDDDIAF